jgi:hypothetical protein
LGNAVQVLGRIFILLFSVIFSIYFYRFSPGSIYSPAMYCLLLKGIAVSFILPHAAPKLHVYPSYQKPHLHILYEAFISIAFVQVVLDGCLKSRNFLGKEKRKRKKGIEFTIAFQQIQVQPCSNTISPL